MSTTKVCSAVGELMIYTLNNIGLVDPISRVPIVSNRCTYPTTDRDNEHPTDRGAISDFGGSPLARVTLWDTRIHAYQMDRR